MPADNNTERENNVLELYNKGKINREIAKEQRLSLRYIGLILKNHGVNHGIASIEQKSHSNNEKTTQASMEKAVGSSKICFRIFMA
ncbi:MAG: hypothetical protein JO327_14060 [Nitrososphaeraceae archaeon]|nr:hypothetical protein [Nitrososphaeraceae archaeon]MBV9669236.1 hypothetical protein [Nitrososphaeraceae archaeon]